MTTTILTRDIATRYAALRAAVLASVGPEQFAQIEYDTQQSLLESAPVPEDADLVSIADLSDLDGDEDTDPVDDEETRREVKAARTTYSWIVRFEVCGTWIADGFDLTHERALDMLATDLGMANIGEELNARVIAAPPADTIAQEQGYKSAADKFERDANRDVDAEARVSKALDGAREAKLLAEVERTYEEGRLHSRGRSLTPHGRQAEVRPGLVEQGARVSSRTSEACSVADDFGQRLRTVDPPIARSHTTRLVGVPQGPVVGSQVCGEDIEQGRPLPLVGGQRRRLHVDRGGEGAIAQAQDDVAAVDGAVAWGQNALSDAIRRELVEHA